jgi:hypothetical protein
LSRLISEHMAWDIDYVKDNLLVRLYFSSQFVRSGTADSRTYWATDTRYPHYKGVRRDMVEVDMGNNNRGMAQLIAFIEMEHLPPSETTMRANRILIRWLDVPARSRSRDDYGRPLCEYPLCHNHCLWEWEDVGRIRPCFSRRGFMNLVNRQHMWSHVPSENRQQCINGEKRARYDILQYHSIICHANIALDPSTGHMLQTIQMI